jgi:hypothetical protein
MAKKLVKAQMGKIVKGAVKAVSKAAKPMADISKNEIKNAVTLSERARLKEKLQALSKKQMGGSPEMSKGPKAPAATSIPSISSAKKTDTLSKRKPINDTSLISNAAKTKIMQKGGSLKPVDSSKNPGLSKLPTPVRNKMGYQKNGGAIKTKKK